MNCTTPLGNETSRSRVVKTLFLGIIFVLALLLNVKTFLVLLKRKRQHRNVVTIFLLNLTLVSALMVLQVPFNIRSIVDQGWSFGETFCQFNGFSNVFLCMNLIFTLLCLTIDRYLAVVKPLQHRALMNRRTAYKMLVAVYFLSFLLAIIPILGKARYKYHPGTNHCSPAWSNSCGYAAAMTTLAFILPILGMLITYTRIFLTLRKKRVLMNKSSPSTMSSKDISMQDTDSNSPENFEDTSTDPSGDSVVKMTARQTLVDPEEEILEYDLQPVSCDEHIAGEEATWDSKCTRRLTTRKTAGHWKENFVENASGTGLCNEHLTGEDSIARTRLDDNGVTGVTGFSVIGSNVEDKRANQDAGLTTLGVDVKGLVKRFSSSGVEQKLVGRYITDDPEMSSTDTNVAKGVALPGICLPGKVTSDTPSNDNESDSFNKEETQRAENKQVSFQNVTEISPIKTQAKKEGTERRLSSISPVSRSRKAINFLVSRMKKHKAIRHEYKIARTGTILVLSFLILWMPYVIAHSCFLGRCHTMTFYNIATFFVYTNALANPIIYALTNRAVMQDIRKSMGKLCRSR